MSYHRYGHGSKCFVKVGDKVKKGQLIGHVGDGNGQFPKAAHVHYDIFKKKPANYWDFPIGKSKSYVKEWYKDPEPYKYIVLPEFTHEGLNYLQFHQYPNGPCYHPGDDLNSGAASTDYGDKFFSATDGEVVHVYAGTGSNHGWGQLIVIKEKEHEPDPEPVPPIPEPPIPPVPPTPEPLPPTPTPEPLPPVPPVDPPMTWLEWLLAVLRKLFNR